MIDQKGCKHTLLNSSLGGLDSVQRESVAKRYFVLNVRHPNALEHLCNGHEISNETPERSS